MCQPSLLERPVDLDWKGMLRNLRREGTPDRVYNIEVRIDDEVLDSVTQRYALDQALRKSERFYRLRRDIAVYRFLGIELLRCIIPDFYLLPHVGVSDEDYLAGRAPLIKSWQDLERYPWPEPEMADLSSYEWLEQNLPEDMSVFMPHIALLFLNLVSLMGFEGLCMNLYDQPELVDATIQQIGQIHCKQVETLCSFNCVKVIFGGDDWGSKTDTMISPKWMTEKIVPWFKKFASIAHEHDRLYLMHNCGNLKNVMPALIEDVSIDGLHSYQDEILPVTEAKKRYGRQLAILGGIDVDFLCRSDHRAIRKRVRDTLDICMPGGGYCLGTGNSVAHYVPLENYLVMVDEGRRYCA